MSYKKYYQKVESFFSKNPDYVVSSVSMKEIKKAEKKLNVQFSEMYKKFISKYGGALLEANSIYGLRKEEMMGNLWSVTELTKFYRDQKYPGTEDWYIVSDDGSGNPFGVDPQGKVWLSDHNTGQIIKVAEDFEEFLYKIFTDTLWD